MLGLCVAKKFPQLSFAMFDFVVEEAGEIERQNKRGCSTICVLHPAVDEVGCLLFIFYVPIQDRRSNTNAIFLQSRSEFTKQPAL